MMLNDDERDLLRGLADANRKGVVFRIPLLELFPPLRFKQ